MADNVLEPYTFSFGDAKSASNGCSSRVWDFPTSIFAMQNKQMYIRLHCLRVLWSLSTCFPNLKIILQIRPSVFKFNLKRTVIFLLRKFSCLHPQQAGRAGTNSQFLNQILQIWIQKRLLGFAQTRYSAKNCAGCTFSLTLNKQISWRKIRFRKISVDSFNIASSRNYHFRF